MNKVEGGVDLIKRNGVSDEIVDIDIEINVKVKDIRKVGEKEREEEGGEFKEEEGEEMEREGGDLIEGLGKKDNDRLKKEEMEELKRMKNKVGIESGVEGIVRKEIGKIMNGMKKIVIEDLERVDEVSNEEIK